MLPTVEGSARNDNFLRDPIATFLEFIDKQRGLGNGKGKG